MITEDILEIGTPVFLYKDNRYDELITETTISDIVLSKDGVRYRVASHSKEFIINSVDEYSHHHLFTSADKIPKVFLQKIKDKLVDKLNDANKDVRFYQEKADECQSLLNKLGITI